VIGCLEWSRVRRGPDGWIGGNLMVLTVFSVDIGGWSDFVAIIHILPLSSMPAVALSVLYISLRYAQMKFQISHSSSALVSSIPHIHRNARPLLAL